MLRHTLVAPLRAAGASSRVLSHRPVFRNQFRPVPSLPTRPLPSAFSRFYSAETETPAKSPAKSPATEDSDGSLEPNTASEASESPGDEAVLKIALAAKTKEALDWKDKYLRSVADFRNLQDRTERSMKSARDFAIQGFAKDLVDSVDNFDRALTMVPEEKLKASEEDGELKDLANLFDGLRMTEKILMSTLKKHGLERFDPQGEKFNPNEHEATFMTPMPDKEHNTVFHTQQKGFKLNGRVLRAAKVGVAKNN